MATFAELIASHHEEILQCWVKEAGQLAAARGLSRPELTNIMPKYLAALGLPEGGGGERQHQLENHLSSRLRAGYRLDEALEELSILGRCVVQSCPAVGADGGMDAAELLRFYEALHRDSTLVISAFTQYLNEDAQEEKYYLRRLQALANKALHGGPEEGALEARLKEVLELVMEAMRAQSAAILFHDVERRSLWMAASAGVAEEPLVRYATSEAPASFAAAVASHEEETTAVVDAATTELEVSDALRQSGIHALLGVRLPERRTLVGVLYVGLTERRPFSSRELHRLETLGEQLSLHLDNARLYATLRASIEELRVEHELRERFISVLAHDLRGPLSVMRMGAHLLCGDAERLGEHREIPGRVLRNVIRTDRMVQELLDVMRVRAGHGLPLTLAECDLAEVARAAVEELTTVYGERFVLRCATRVQGVWSADTLQRAIWNLATNAVKYGSTEHPITVIVRRPNDGGAEIVVHNEGPVIPPEARVSLFEPFARLPSDLTGARPGWGLGLTFVKSCAEAHGGTIEVESEAGLGTTFTLRIPSDARPFQTDA